MRLHHSRIRSVRSISSLAVAIIVFAGCGDDGNSSPEAGDQVVTLPTDAAGAEEVAEEMADEMVTQLEEQQATSGGGSATLVVGDQTWSFGSVLCGFGPEQIGDPEAEFVLSAIQDGLQLYVSIDGYGHSITLDDVQNFSDPSVSLANASDLGAAPPEEFIIVDGKSVRATTGFMDMSDESNLETIEGTLTATCP